MDGEHAFSTTLTLILVNVALPYNERDATAMETAFSVLRGMAEKGNEYVQARHALLLNLRTSMGQHMTSPVNAFLPPSTTQNLAPNRPGFAPISVFAGPESVVNTNALPQASFQPFQDISFNFNVDDDDKLWEEISGNIDIDMDTGWIESTLRRDYEGPNLSQ